MTGFNVTSKHSQDLNISVSKREVFSEKKLIIETIETSLSGRIKKTFLKALKFLAMTLGAFAGITKNYFAVKWYRNRSLALTAESLLLQGHIQKALDKFDERSKNPADFIAKTALAEFGFYSGERKVLKKQNIIKKDPFYGSKVKFSNLELQALEVISKIEKMGYAPTSKDKTFLRQFFSHITGNQDFNKRISKLGKSESHIKIFKDRKFEYNTLSYLREYSYKSQNLHELLVIAPKFNRIGKLLVINKKHESTEKLTLSEFRQADSFLNMHSALSWIDRFQLWPDDNAFMRKLSPMISDLEFGIKKIDDRFNEEHGYETGNIILDTMKESCLYENRAFNIANKVDWMLRIQKNIFKHKYVHASLGLQAEDGYKIAEIDADYQDSQVSFSRLCIAKTYRFNFGRLISERGLIQCRGLFKHHPELKHFNSDEEIIKYLEKLFKETIQDFFSNPERFAKISNNHNKIRQISTVVKKHYRKKGIKPEEIDFESEQPMICSEFIGKVLVHCLQKVDRKLGEILKIALINKYPHTQPAVADRLFLNGGLLKNPISKFENFSAMHVDRLFALIAEYTEEVPRPKFIDHIVQVRT